MATKKRVHQVEHEDVLVQFNKLHFDPVNPRGEPENDEEKIRALFGAESETAILATHLAEHGQNPLDRLGIIEHSKLPGHYVIREGNRRLCAMQLLRDPERSPTLAVRKTFQRLASTGRPIPDQIQAVLFHEQPKARVWMSVKHEGPQNGLGTLTWGPTQKARFNREGETGTTRPKNPNRQAEALLTYAVTRELISAEERALISITTVTRYLPNVRTALALLNTEDCLTNAPPEEFDAALRQFLKDAKEPGSPGVKAEVHSRSSAAERKTYAESLRNQGLSPKTRDLTPYDPARQPATQPATKLVTRPRSLQHPGKRKHLIFSSFVVPVRDPILLRLVTEGKELDPDQYRFSCNYLIRVILERIVYRYAKQHGVGAQGEFSDVAQRVITHAKASNDPPSKGIATVLTKTADKKSVYSYDMLSNGTHGGSIPSGADNRSNWETLQPALEYLLSHMT
ncbi:hypothetical protein [Variovorax sp.]|uniref:hypothetical protein n=1 Tax=Variovorax sp. TaxID=1871043 RepID=UPI003BAAF901